jgi:hypothetical protein
MNSFTPQNYINSSSQPIFSAKTIKNHAGVGQDKDHRSGDHSASLEAYREKAASDRTVLRND